MTDSDHAGTPRRRVAVLGASGFVGTAVAAAFERAGDDVSRVSAPRLAVRWGTDPVVAATAWRAACLDQFDALVRSLDGVDTIVLAAGSATPTAPESDELWGANAVLPAVIAEAAQHAGAARMIHVSSAAVQGSVDELDEAPFVDGQTPYATSKGFGERGTLAASGPSSVVVYRPTSVLGSGRPIAARLAGVLRSRWLVVPSGDPPLPVALLENVADAVVFIARTTDPPLILLHPWEGMTVRSLARAFGRDGGLRQLPTVVGRPLQGLVRLLVRRGGPTAGKVRRIEMLWDGQRQRSSLPELGFAPSHQDARYAALGDELRLEPASSR